MWKLLISMLALVMPAAVNAAERDRETDHVIVTMNDGSVVEGYVTAYWSETGLFKGLNRAFKMTSTADGDDEKRYTADEVKSVRFVRQAGGDIDEGVISADVANPTTFKPHKVIRQFVHVDVSNDVGTIYWWNGIDRQQMQLGSMQVSTIYGVRLNGDSVIIPFMTGSVVSLNPMRIVYKHKDKALVDYIDRRILRGGSSLWSRMAAEPALFLYIAEEYLKDK